MSHSSLDFAIDNCCQCIDPKRPLLAGDVAITSMDSLQIFVSILVLLIAVHRHVQGCNRARFGVKHVREQGIASRHAGDMFMALSNDAGKQVVIRTGTNGDINNVAKFLSVSMYANKPIPVGQQKELYRLEFLDLKSRYASESIVRGYYSSLILAEIDGEIVGAVGLDCQILNRELKKFKKLTVNSLAYVDNDEEEIVVVLANLAVRADQRRKGIGKLLLQKCETYARSYISTSNREKIDSSSIYLTVDSENKKAIKLYKQNGYKVVFEDENATCVVTGDFSLKTEDCINLCLKKTVGVKGKGIFGGLLGIF